MFLQPDYPCPLIDVLEDRAFLEIPQLKKVCLAVYTRPNLRSYASEIEMYMGLNVLKDLFDHETPKNNDTTELFLSFPERWLNIIEQRSLFTRIGLYCKNIETLFIKTNSVYVIQCCRKEYIRILTPEGFSGILPMESETGKLYI